MSLLGYLGAKRVPKVLQDSSRGRFSSNLVAFGVDLVRFFQDFRTYFSTTSRLISHSILLFLQHQSNNVSARGSNFQFRHGGGLARAAHWIRRPREAAGRACVNRVSKSINFYLSNPSLMVLGGPTCALKWNLHVRRSFTFSTQVAHLRPS